MSLEPHYKPWEGRYKPQEAPIQIDRTPLQAAGSLGSSHWNNITSHGNPRYESLEPHYEPQETI